MVFRREGGKHHDRVRVLRVLGKLRGRFFSRSSLLWQARATRIVCRRGGDEQRLGLVSSKLAQCGPIYSGGAKRAPLAVNVVVRGTGVIKRNSGIYGKIVLFRRGFFPRMMFLNKNSVHAMIVNANVNFVCASTSFRDRIILLISLSK